MCYGSYLEEQDWLMLEMASFSGGLFLLEDDLSNSTTGYAVGLISVSFPSLPWQQVNKHQLSIQLTKPTRQPIWSLSTDVSSCMGTHHDP